MLEVCGRIVAVVTRVKFEESLCVYLYNQISVTMILIVLTASTRVSRFFRLRFTPPLIAPRTTLSMH